MFTLKLKNFTLNNCYFQVGEYRNGNKALQVFCDEEFEEDLICTCSVNATRINEEDEIGIKDYSENEGMVDFLKKEEIIEGEPISTEQSGFLTIPYYRLTKKGLDLYKV